MKFRSFFAFLVIGILLLTTFYFFAQYRITKTEYYEYRTGIFTRAYESILADLSAYLQTEDTALASRIVARLSELPLSSEEENIARLLAKDMAEGAFDREAKRRAQSYSETLLRYLSGHRTQAYSASWRASGMELPAYPGESLPVAAVPEDPPDPEALRKEKAVALLGSRSLVAYTRKSESGTVAYGYRTASSYVELREDGRLIRMLLPVQSGETVVSEADCLAAAERFLAEQAWTGLVPEGAETVENTRLFTFRGEDITLKVGVSINSGTVFLLRV